MSVLRASLQCGRERGKPDARWGGAGGDLGGAQNTSPARLCSLIEQEAGRLCFNQLIASLGIQQPDQVP